jgi:glucans biosynthesis protein
MSSNHPRNTIAMLASPRCGAKTRSGTPCKSPAVRGKKRCRMHGGAFRSGAPCGNKNALKHGRFTREFFDQRRRTNELIKTLRRSVDSITKMKG